MTWSGSLGNCLQNRTCLIYLTSVIGAYVTAGTRIHLYRFWLQKNVIYCDTDSCIFIQPSGETWPIATGDKLGDMQSELKPSEFINVFVCGGPKNYTHRLITNEGE